MFESISIGYIYSYFQALFRGYLLRKRLHQALNYAQYDVCLTERDDLEMVDMSDFDFPDIDNLDDIDKDWLPSETPQLPPK